MRDLKNDSRVSVTLRWANVFVLKHSGREENNSTSRELTYYSNEYR